VLFRFVLFSFLPLQAVNTVVAGILHDVMDDTSEKLKSIEEQFGDDVASLVSGVSKLSYINQVTCMLREHAM
jgi:(p)ppGpp synthase/HD superfamily hydrolase